LMGFLFRIWPVVEILWAMKYMNFRWKWSHGLLRVSEQALNIRKEFLTKTGENHWCQATVSSVRPLNRADSSTARINKYEELLGICCIFSGGRLEM
jgi:hypothetical protein